MARKKSKAKSERTYQMFPSLHDEVARLLMEDDLKFDFEPTDDARGSIKTYDTNIMGRFNCHNGACKGGKGGWGSRRIAITIRMYAGARYNARVYFQRCQSCNKLCKPTLDGSYAERVGYRIKKWCGIEMEELPYKKHKGRPHRGDLCEGCRDGHCSELRRDRR